MSEYHKIQTIFKRDPTTKFKTLLEGEWSLPEFEYLAYSWWQYTEKVDGTNIRVIPRYGDSPIFRGRTDAAVVQRPLAARLSEIFAPAIDIFPKVFDNLLEVTLFGEGYGPKIQKVGSLYRADPGFVLFDVRVGRWWLQRDDVIDVAEKLGIDVVPVIGEGSLYTMVKLVREGIASTWGNFPAEGIVARPTVELCSRNGHRIIAKLKTRDFL